ncbi:transposase family protein [Streptomyces sp. NPDC005820]|uniref:transposase family protein n=1 Tax=Streptomyces sp. NPDC005820 TaxID=3157069 RepID=UPI0033D5619D
MLLVVVSGARTITEITEWGQRAAATVLEQFGIRRHLPGRRHAPSHSTLTRLLAALDGDALDDVIGAYLAERDHTDVGTTGSAPRSAIAVDGEGAVRLRPPNPALPAPAVRRRRPPSARCWNYSIWPAPWSPSTPCTASRTRCAGWCRRRRPTTSR